VITFAKKGSIMSKVRRTFTADFKAKVALEALQERSSMGEICKKYDLHPNVVGGWKKEFQCNMGLIFSDEKEKKANDKLVEKERVIDDLYKKIGRLEMDNEWLKKKLQPWL
jgi:transposase-like protein